MELAIPTVEYFLDHPDAVPPVYSSSGAAGMDLAACENGKICGKSQAVINTGIRFAIPKGWHGHVRSRSGLTVKFKTDVPTGSIDSDFRGPVSIVIRNNRKKPFKFTKGTKLAQMIISPSPQAVLVKKQTVEELGITERGSNGFGSTGL
jgi:dUTP pyrophosphatase